MPNKKAAIKDLRQTKKRTLRNSLISKNIKELIKKGQKAASEGKKVDDISKQLQKTVDKAVKNNILKANTANRKKARFAQMVKRAATQTKAKPSEQK